MSKNTWPCFPIGVGSFTLANTQHACKEANTLDDLKLGFVSHRKNDPKKLIEGHFKSLMLKPTWKDEEDPQELLFQGAINFDKVFGKITDMDLTMELRSQQMVL